ncbi:MAG: response regulator transcription factor [Bacteroidetes bacterium]|nr:response regulator transcription factor [Bacteroidota bacterium]
MGRRVLVADDDRKTVEIVKLYLERDGYNVITAHDGGRALIMAREQHPDLVVLDIMMPELDGLDVCRLLRAESSVPIILLTARTTEGDRIFGLDLGADDYVAKPFSPGELAARVRAIFRRVAEQEAEEGPQQLELGGLTVDFRRHEAVMEGKPVLLTPTEFRLLKVLAGDAGRAFSRAQLVDRVLGDGYEGFERTIDVHVLNLRRKIEPDPTRPTYLLTVYGVGYKLGGDIHVS